MSRSGWNAMIGGLGGNQQDKSKQEDPGSKPLLRILPTGPAHQVLRLFRNRTLYSNVVNDGIVPLRTSCLLFLDWRGLGKVDKARRENGLIGTMANWGFNELTGASSSPNPSKAALNEDSEDYASDDVENNNKAENASVPQPAADSTNQDDEAQDAATPGKNMILSSKTHTGRQSSIEANEPAKEPEPSALDQFLSWLRPSSAHTKKDVKMFKRSQTLEMQQELERQRTEQA
ncbi:hypothetical protein LTS18_001444, partial [Coniosporium uncinatum]